MRKHILSSLLLSTALIAGCGGTEDDLINESVGEVAQADDGKEDGPSIPFTVFSDDTTGTGTTVTREIFANATAYAKYFGHSAPASVNFSTHYVVYYSAGVKNTGGYKASIEKVTTSNSGLTLKVTTALESPGAGCFVTQSLTRPNVLVKFRKPSPRPYYLSFYKHDTVRDCSAGKCTKDSDCELSDNYCGGCACEALDPGEQPTTCSNPVNCFAQPCLNKVARCQSNKCVVATKPAGIACGNNTCTNGQYCCNASCGMCANPGVFCIQIACAP